MAKRKLTFEQAVDKLELIVSRIEQGEVSLEESIEKYAEGIELIKQCRGILDSAEKKIQILTEGDETTLEEAGELSDDQDQSPPAGSQG